MRLRIDHDADALYMDFLVDTEVDSSDEVAPGIILDYDATGHLVGIEVLDASKRSTREALSSISIEWPRSAAG